MNEQWWFCEECGLSFIHPEKKQEQTELVYVCPRCKSKKIKKT
jgi:DNA-directed RNA polymerase subunit RPC12/RpoP